MTKMSIAITSYEMGGVGHEVIQYALRSLQSQTFKDFEVVVSDQSKDSLIEDVCKLWQKDLSLVYCREENKRGYFTANENNAIKHCSGDIIKFLDADDFLYDEKSLQKTYGAFEENTMWVVTNYMHSYNRTDFIKRHSPVMNDRIYVCNTIGTPSCVAIRNDNPPLFDENLRWAGDCEWYKRLYDKWGNPKIIDDITAVHLLWDGQVENTFGSAKELQDKEVAYILAKHEGEAW